jgi:hypothetical protein
MPPVAKKRKAEEPLASKAGRMLMQCSRSALEEMLLAAVQSGTPVTLSHIESALPDPQPLVAKPSAVESGPARTGTGFFDVVSGEQHLDIFRKLSLRDRLTVCIAVCKAWRAFRSEPSLWRVIDGFPRGGAHAWINAKGFHRLMRWLPKDCAEVYSYISHSKLDDKVMDAACICEGMKLHRRWVGGITKSQPDPYSAPVLKSLTLRGKRVASTVLRTASALFGSSLERIDIGGHNNRKVAIKVCRDPPPTPPLPRSLYDCDVTSAGHFKASQRNAEAQVFGDTHASCSRCRQHRRNTAQVPRRGSADHSPDLRPGRQLRELSFPLLQMLQHESEHVGSHDSCCPALPTRWMHGTASNLI